MPQQPPSACQALRLQPATPPPAEKLCHPPHHQPGYLRQVDMPVLLRFVVPIFGRLAPESVTVSSPRQLLNMGQSVCLSISFCLQYSLCVNWPWMWRSLRASAAAFSAAVLLRRMVRAVPSMNSCTAWSATVRVT